MERTLRGRVVILEEYCKGCGCCTQACPQELLRIGSHINPYGYNPAVFSDEEGACRACLLCARFCPDGAIEVYTIKNEESDQNP